MIFKKILSTPFKAMTLTVVISATLTGCSDMNTFMDDLQTMTSSTIPNQSTLSQSTPKAIKKAPQDNKKLDLVGLLMWFENSCGSTKMAYTPGTEENKRKMAFNIFKESFMGQRYQDNGNYKPYVKPDYRNNLPPLLTNVIKDISVIEDNEGVHYYVDFKNTTYRGYDLSRLELFYKPETDYVYDVLYFKNNNFVELKPIFKTTIDDLDVSRGGRFDVQDRSITCYLGL